MTELNRGKTINSFANDMDRLEQAQLLPTFEDNVVNKSVAKLMAMFELIKQECADREFKIEFKKDKFSIWYPQRFQSKSDYDYETLAGMAMMAAHFDADFSIRVLENQYGYLQPIVDNVLMRELNVEAAFDYVHSVLDKFLQENPDEKIRTVGVARCIFNHNFHDNPPYCEVINIFKDGGQMTAPYWRDAFFWATLNKTVSFQNSDNGGVTFGQAMRDSYYKPAVRIIAEINNIYGRENG